MDFYRRVGREPAVAEEVLAQLDIDPEMKRAHLALYLRCRQSLRTHAYRQARAQRIGLFVRWLCHGLFVMPARALRQSFRFGGDLAAECVPERARVQAESAARRSPRKSDRVPAQTKARPQAAASAATLPASGAEGSPSRLIWPDLTAAVDGPAAPRASAPGAGAAVLTAAP